MSRARSKARNCAVQSLYEWQVSGNSVEEIFKQFLVERNTTKFDTEYFKELLFGITEKITQLDEQIQPHLDRPIDEVDPVERAVLRLGAFELIHKRDVPYRVAINEAVDVAKLFGADQGHKYVNGVLDKVARRVREVEMKASR